MILFITGIVFIGTQIVFVVACYRFADKLDAQGKPVRKAQYFHGSQRLEVIWTILPAAILVFIAFYQLGTWTSIKFRSAAPRVPPLAEVTARQFQWVIRYPGPDGKLNTRDDLFTVNDLHFVKSKENPRPALIYLRSSDVIHSFYLPHMRIKQDAVPGLLIPVWFDADTAGEYELVCAELCGWGHYKMRGKVTVHETEAEFDKWIGEQIKEQNREPAQHDGRFAREMRRMSSEPTSGGSHGSAPESHGHGSSHDHSAREWPRGGARSRRRA